MLRAYKFRIYPTADQQQYLSRCFGASRLLAPPTEGSRDHGGTGMRLLIIRVVYRILKFMRMI